MLSVNFLSGSIDSWFSDGADCFRASMSNSSHSSSCFLFLFEGPALGSVLLDTLFLDAL